VLLGVRFAHFRLAWGKDRRIEIDALQLLVEDSREAAQWWTIPCGYWRAYIRVRS